MGLDQEHRLTGYGRIDTKEKPFLCKCGAAFTRRDLLTRHYRLSKHDDDSVSNVVVTSTESDFDRTAAAESLSCLSGVPVQQWPAVQPVDNVFGDLDHRHVHDGASRDAYHQSLLGPQMFSQGSSTSLNSPHYLQPRMKSESSDVLTNDSIGDDLAGFDQFREFADFLDGIGLPAEWSPYFNPPEEFVDPELRNGEASNGGSGPGTRPGTPFSSWLPSAPAGNRITGPVSTESEFPALCLEYISLTYIRSKSSGNRISPVQGHRRTKSPSESNPRSFPRCPRPWLSPPITACPD
jgi:hypothetical protein